MSSGFPDRFNRKAIIKKSFLKLKGEKENYGRKI